LRPSNFVVGWNFARDDAVGYATNLWELAWREMTR
jgi:hypothetical protein